VLHPIIFRDDGVAPSPPLSVSAEQLRAFLAVGRSRALQGQLGRGGCRGCIGPLAGLTPPPSATTLTSFFGPSSIRSQVSNLVVNWASLSSAPYRIPHTVRCTPSRPTDRCTLHTA
jgi:hypothetical protein